MNPSLASGDFGGKNSKDTAFSLCFSTSLIFIVVQLPSPKVLFDTSPSLLVA
jgi:hypothetical protein